MKVGTCGWGYFPEKGDRLRNYVRAGYSVVEVNSTFYRIPRESTAAKWREKVDEINSKFEFTVKVSKIITHLDKFSSQKSVDAFEQMKAVGKALRAKILIFQSPHSFRPTANNLKNADAFFSRIDRERFILGWEVRWKSEWTREIVSSLFKRLDIVHVVDPLRQDSYNRKFGYYRLHGFGTPMMYNYTFSDEELRECISKIGMNSYVLFNNFTMYDDAKRFTQILKTKDS
ncbi:MAG: DUF72 domain-containing protein [Candidatus Micrarchaeia archaeon]